MSPSAPAVCRAIAASVFSGAMLFGSAAIAMAQPPPNCSAADLARVQAGVSTATADYLTANSEVNEFFTGLKGQDREVMKDNVQNYLDDNPQIKDELSGIRQPVRDFKERCQ
ncbi:MAG: heme-binding protein [Actinomycetia bacterium]|nr:heme-binding protein [Actinomycetes bacterium]MCH9710812.1 heme-binding protein [Actinomycetes bacterium]MCH9766923.1 heme-binding protein [Actinomycetes bacterium]